MATYDLTTTTPSKLAAGDILNIPYSGDCITINLPKGSYKLEAWGAYGPYSSASPSSSHTYGYGGYASGTITLTSKLTLYCYVGGTPLSTYTNNYYYGGWNGGGSKVYSSSYRDNGPGGGATDFCLVKGTMTLDSYYRYVRDSASYLSRLLVAGGGGGGRTNNVQSQGGYCPVTATATQTYAGGMTATGSSVASGTVTGGFGYGGTSTNTSDDRAAGGGGWYGGNSAGDSYGGGGSSFAWCDAYSSYVPSGYSVDETYKLTDVSLLLGSSNNCPAGVKSDGYARITVISVAAVEDTFLDLIIHGVTYPEVKEIEIPLSSSTSTLLPFVYVKQSPSTTGISYTTRSIKINKVTYSNVYLLKVPKSGDTSTKVMYLLAVGTNKSYPVADDNEITAGDAVVAQDALYPSASLYPDTTLYPSDSPDVRLWDSSGKAANGIALKGGSDGDEITIYVPS